MRILDGWYGDRALPYEEAWELQRQLLAERADDLSATPSSSSNTRRSTPPEAHRAIRAPVDGTPVVDVDRGGKITWHGPGQLVGYPITKLPVHVDVVDYVRRIEQVLIHVCADLGVSGGRVAGRSRVWVPADTEWSRPQDRRHRHSGVSRRHDARLRPQLPTATCRGTTGSCRAASPTPA